MSCTLVANGLGRNCITQNCRHEGATSDLSQPEGTTVATFANDTAIMAVDDVAEATDKL
jgi:hypothetical protein